MTNSMGTSLFTESKASSNLSTELLGTICRTGRRATASCDPMETHETIYTTEYATLGATTWQLTSTAIFTTDTMTTTIDEKQSTKITTTTTTMSSSSNTTTLTTFPEQTTISIQAMTTISQNISISIEARPATNTNNKFHVDVMIEQIVIPGHANANHPMGPKSAHRSSFIDDSSESTEKLSKDEKGNTKSTKIWITVGVFLGWLKNDLESEFLCLGLIFKNQIIQPEKRYICPCTNFNLDLVLL